MLRRASLAASLALASACVEQGAAPQVQLTTTSCMGAPPLEGVTHLRLRVTGEGLFSPIERITPVGIRPEDVPAIPPGPGRVLEVRGYSGEPSSAGSVVSVGRSFPFDMPEKGPPAEPVHVTLRRVNTFLPMESAEAPGTCLELTEARAGHTATILADGRVILAGGFRMDSEGAIETLSSIEILDTRAQTLTFLERPGDGAVSRAFHTSALMLDGRVVLIGGEAQAPGGPSVPLSTAVVFNPDTLQAQPFNLARARSRHASAIDIAGRVLVVGGVGEGGAVISEPEGVEPASGRTFPVPTPLPRVGATAVPLSGSQRIAVIGGSDGVDVSREVLTFAFNGSTFSPSSASVLLRQARRDAAVAAFEEGQRLLVMGGYAVASPEIAAKPVPTSEVIDPRAEAPGVSTGPSVVARGDLCAVTLPDGRVFTAGGRFPTLDGNLISAGVVELITPTENVTGGVLGMMPLDPSRYLHTCTLLPDGSVLVAGGVSVTEVDTGEEDPLLVSRLVSGTYLFMPVPRD